VCHFVCISYQADTEATNKASNQARDKSKAGGELTEPEARYIARYTATQKARDKSKAGGVLTEPEARYIARYCHSALCHSLTRLPPSVHIY